MHDSVQAFVQQVLGAQQVTGKSVLEVGAYDVNGSVRPYLESLAPRTYLGVDAEEGPGVDRVANCERLASEIHERFDVVVTTEMMEHVRDWKACVDQLITVVAPGGLLVITTRSHGFPYHAHPEDHWRYTYDDMRVIASTYGLIDVTIENDLERPGVFMVARKPQDWVAPGRPLTLEVEKINAPIPVAGTGKPLTTPPVNKLLVAYPLYKQVPASWFINWLTLDKTMVMGYTATDGVYITLAMGKLFAAAMKTPGWDRLVICEHDMILPPDAFQRIACYGKEYDIVGSAYFQHREPFEIMAWMQPNAPWFTQVTGQEEMDMMEDPGLYKVDAVGFGLTSIARHVIEDWDDDLLMFEPNPHETPVRGHDFTFCTQARKQGFTVWVDSGLSCGHLTETEIGYGHSQEALAHAVESDGLRTWAESAPAR